MGDLYAMGRGGTYRLTALDHNHFRADRLLENLLALASRKQTRENAALLCLVVGCVGLIWVLGHGH